MRAGPGPCVSTLLAAIAAVLLGGESTAEESAAGTGADATPRTGGFALARATVPEEKILAGGPGRDGIRSVDEPVFVPAGEVTWVGPNTPVLGVALGGEARAYPVHLLEYHQIVNDVVGGVPIALTYDPLTSTPRAFRSTLDDRALHFGVSGLIYNSNFVLYDRETESLWSQFLGSAIAGPLAGRELSRVSVLQLTREAWQARYPESGFLARPDPLHIDYRHSPFEAYWTQDAIPFAVEAEDRRFHAKDLVLGVVVRGRARAYLGSILTRAGGSATEEFEGARIRVDYDPNTALFSWNVPDGVEVTEAYWFAWKAFHPDTGIWREGSKPE